MFHFVVDVLGDLEKEPFEPVLVRLARIFKQFVELFPDVS